MSPARYVANHMSDHRFTIWKDLIVLPDGTRLRAAAQRAEMRGLPGCLDLVPEATTNSQVAQEVQYILLLSGTQHIKRADHLVGFRAVARMLLDGG
jgi:hypothetical protein